MKKKRPLILILAGCTLFMLAMTGCQGMTEKETVLKWPSIWVGEDPKAGIVKELVDEFNTLNEGKYRVDIEANPDYDAYQNKIITQISAGAVPDLFILNPDKTSMAFYEGDLLMDFAEELKGDWGKDFVSGSLKNATIKGETKSIPYEMGYTPVWYNMDILNKSGVDRIPETYDEFFAACDKIKAAGYIPTSQMTGGINAWTSMLWFSHIATAIGGPDVWKKDITDPVFVEAASILNRMFQDGNTSKDAIGGDAGVSGGHYLSGKSAIFINGPWYIGRTRKEAPEVYKATRIGYAPGAAYSKATIGFALSNLAAAQTDDPAKKEAVLAFMKWMTKPENVKKVSFASGGLLAIKYPVGPDEEIDPLQAQFINNINESSFVNTHFQANFMSDVVAEFGQALAKMALGKSTPEEFVQQIKSKIR